MHRVELSAGTIEYTELGEGPPVVLCHGVWMDGSQWAPVAERLRGGFRCLLPVLPLGAHRLPLRPDADLSLRGLAALIAEFLEALDLRQATVAFNDWCAAQIMVADGRTERVARLVLADVETDDNYPPGLPGRVLDLAGKTPGGLTLAAQLLRFRAFRRSPVAFGRMSRRPVPPEVMDAWFAPARQDPAIRRDLRKYVASTGHGARALAEATRQLSRFPGPVLVAWGADDRVMPPESGRRLAGLFPQGRFAELPDCGTLAPWDQPALLADKISEFVRAT